jgi:hypothetical protein
MVFLISWRIFATRNRKKITSNGSRSNQRTIQQTGGFMCNDKSFIKKPFEEIPDGFPNPEKKLKKAISAKELLRRLTERNQQTKNNETLNKQGGHEGENT